MKAMIIAFGAAAAISFAASVVLPTFFGSTASTTATESNVRLDY